MHSLSARADRSELAWPVGILAIAAGLVILGLWSATSTETAQLKPRVRTFIVNGVVKEIRLAENTLVVAHEAIPNYMPAMTMPFKVRDAAQMAGLSGGNQIAFRLQVSETESWIDRIKKTGDGQPSQSPGTREQTAAVTQARPHHPLLDYHFTNELGQAVSLGDFHGQALAITFFFTRCPIPEFCPRLSKNFQQASQMLGVLSEAPTNWHFLSISFDPEFDTPAVLKTYAESYGYDPKHWSFLTGPEDKIRELAGQSDVRFSRENGYVNHNFRTLIIDANGHLQMVFPTSGNLSESIVTEILKAAAVTNRAS